MKRVSKLLLSFAVISTILPLTSCNKYVKEGPLVIWHDKEDSVISIIEETLHEKLPNQEFEFIRKENLTENLKLVGQDARSAPDMYIFAHDKIGLFDTIGILEPIENIIDTSLLDDYIDLTISSLSYNGRLLGVPLYYETLDWRDITSENMPDEPFVIKCNHDNASYRIIRDKGDVNWKEMRLYYRRRLNGRSFFWTNREWPYKHVQPRIIVEQLLESKGNEYKLREYKFHCFGGQIKVIAFYEIGIDGVERYRHMNNKFQPLSEQCSFGSTAEVLKTVDIPNVSEEMKAIALKLAADFEYYIRVDIYCVDNKLYVGELTFFDGAGFDVIRPSEWNIELGSYLHLPIDKN